MIKKREFIWNTIGSGISSILSAIILAFCTRLNGLEIAGIFSICYATACILNSIGDFGLRIYQVTDTNRKNSFSEYLVARIIAVFLMIVIGVVFTLITGYRKEKLIICLLLILFRAIENLSETYQAEFQLNGRLELGGKTIVYRNIAGIIIFFILDLITKNIIVSMLGFVITNLVIFILYDLQLIKKFAKVDLKVNKTEIIKILKDCLPLAISTLISMYVINAVKYAIDGAGDYTMQTYFNIIYMPTFVINMISIFIIKPFLKPFGDCWNSKDYKKFLKIILIIIGVLALATLCVEIGCYLLGIPFLNLLYGVELSAYKTHLLLLVLSGFLYASANVIFNALGTMRKQKLTTVTYVLTAIFALTIPNKLVALYGITGAVTSCIIIMGLLFVFMTMFFTYVYLKKIKEDKKV
jgi:O-antigen/teichoic acid export membrane protein